MPLQNKKVRKRNHLPTIEEGKFKVYSEQFNAWVESFRDGTTTTSSLSTAAEDNDSVSITESQAASGDHVYASITSYSGAYTTDGLPVILEATASNGSVDLVIGNAHSTNALSGTLDISYLIIKP